MTDDTLVVVRGGCCRNSSCCREVQTLRGLLNSNKERAAEKLLKKYISGRRSAHQIVLGLQALRAQNDSNLLCALAADALRALDPPPTVLWDWLCRHADLLGVNILRRMLRIAQRDPRCARHLAIHKGLLATTGDGIVALAHDGHRVPWGPGLAEPAIAALLERYPGSRMDQSRIERNT